MNPAGRQLVLDFPHRPALGEADFLVSDCNRDAVGWVDRWPSWPAPALAVWGPPASGKTHLTQVWRARSGAVVLCPRQVAGSEPSELLADGNCGIIDFGGGNEDEALADPEALLHLYNSVAELRGHLLLVSRRPPARWKPGLADLASRLNAIPAVAISPPDDSLLGALLVKLCHDRQLLVGEDVLVYLLARMERSFAAARAVVESLDVAGLAERRRITVPLARDVLNRLATDRQGSEEDQD